MYCKKPPQKTEGETRLMSQQLSHTKHLPSGPGAADPPLTFTSNTSPPHPPQPPPQDMTWMAHNQVSVPICLCLLGVRRNKMAKAMTTRAGDSKRAPQRDCLKRIFQMNSAHVALHLETCFQSAGRVKGSCTLEGHRRSTRLWEEPSAFITSHLFIFLSSG